MTKKFELGSKEYQIPAKAKEHYDEKEFEKAKEMYDANDYEVEKGEKIENPNKITEKEIEELGGFEEIEFNEDNKDKKVSKKVEKKIIAFASKIADIEKYDADKELKEAKKKKVSLGLRGFFHDLAS